MTSEKDYHNLLLGVLITSAYGIYEVKSNIESGKGRADIIVTKKSEKEENNENIIIELKKAKSENSIDELFEVAKMQMIEKNYGANLKGKINYMPIVAYGKQYYFE